MARQPELRLSNIEAEQAVLGSLIIDPMAVLDVRNIVTASDFTWPGHAEIYEAVLAVQDTSKTIDILMLTEQLEARKQLQKVGYKGVSGDAYIYRLASMTPTSVHAAHYARIVADYSVRRSLMDAAAQIARLSQDSDTATDALNQAMSLVEAVGKRGNLRGTSMAEAVDEFTIRVSDWLDDPREVWGLPTGIADLDDLTGGIEDHEFMLVAARPGMGKSSLLLQIARHVAEQGYTVAFFSLEMGQTSLMMRLVSSGARIDSHDIKRGRLSEDERSAMWDELASIQRLPITWFCVSAITPQEIVTEVAKLQLRQDVALVVVDYLQLVRSSGENQNIRVSNISRALKELSMTNVAVLAASQLNRAIELRADGIPKLSDLRDSGSLEQDADKVLFLHREINGDDQTAQAILAKNRNGRANVGLRDLVFLEKYACFVDKAR